MQNGLNHETLLAISFRVFLALESNMHSIAVKAAITIRNRWNLVLPFDGVPESSFLDHGAEGNHDRNLKSPTWRRG